MKPIKNISFDSFLKFGRVLDFNPDDNTAFQVIIKESESPWRIGMLRVTEKECGELESHPYSMETFEPVSGSTLLIVSLTDNVNDSEIFFLDKPVCLNKGVWHGIVALSETAVVKITENLEVETVYKTLPKQISIFAG